MRSVDTGFAGVAKLVAALGLGSSGCNGRAGSSPVTRTKEPVGNFFALGREVKKFLAPVVFVGTGFDPSKILWFSLCRFTENLVTAAN